MTRMEYKNIVEGKFLRRPNRFIAYVDIEGTQEKVHVKNTGRCSEILLEGVSVYLEKSDQPNRATAYDLVAADKSGKIINIDSQAPNKVVDTWIRESGFFKNITLVKPEYTYGESRIDFYVETESRKILLEVKGVTLEKEGVMSFPDAPSERAVKHLNELSKAVQNGYECYVFFVIQLEGVSYFRPEADRHPAFASALKEARKAGVHILAYDCSVTPQHLEIRNPVPVFMDDTEYHNHLKGAVNELLPWFAKNKRELPWRGDPSPYHVWLSEIMLQQTRVEAVKPYYARFLEKIPDIEQLAVAEEETLLKLWEGLGYYSRVRNMQSAAKELVDNYNARMPEEYEALKKLKGIGNYTAGAIASISFHKPVPAVDGNVLRVFSRYRMDARNISEESTKQQVFSELLQIMPKEQPGLFNQAVMDLGAMVCIPNGQPLCEICPLQESCLSYQQGAIEYFPQKGEKKARKIEDYTVLVIVDKGKVALRKRPDKGLLAGMYEFPNYAGRLSAEEVLERLKNVNLHPLRILPIEKYIHIFTHKEWHMEGYLIQVDELEETQVCGEALKWEYVKKSDTGVRYPIPSAFATYRKYIK